MRALIILQRNWGVFFGYPIIKRLYRDYPRIEIHALISKVSTVDFFKKQQGLPIKSMHYYSNIYSDWKDKTYPDISLKDIEKELGITSIWEYAFQDRVLCYSLDKLPFIEKSQFGNSDIERYLIHTFMFLKSIIDKANPDFILGPNNVSSFHQILFQYAKQRKIKSLVYTEANVRGYVGFADPLTDRLPLIDRQFQFNLKKPINRNLRDKAKKYIEENRRVLIKQEYSLGLAFDYPKFKDVLSEIFVQMSGWFKNYISKHSVKGFVYYESLSLRKRILRIFERRKNKIDIMKYPFKNDWKTKKYIYYPLQFQPEASTLMLANRYGNQFETARQIASSLPSDYCLVVKEHPAMFGERDISFYQNLDSLPNVYLCDFRLDTNDILSDASLVIGPGMTTSFEAAMKGIGTIRLGNSPIYWPHVRRMESFEQLNGLILDMLEIDFNESQYQRVLVAWVVAVFEKGLNIGFGDIWAGKKSMTEEDLDQYLSNFFETLTQVE